MTVHPSLTEKGKPAYSETPERMTLIWLVFVYSFP